ncbi:MAG: hypothetical protein EBU19_03185 [Gammaproteobacteria bacterium]|mgnify:CR=1 FL=1|jgi:hypothetical protein|nr:hypothetical protein [Gammaproteobacteria bacterium]
MLRKILIHRNYLLALVIILLSVLSVFLNKKHRDFYILEDKLESEYQLISAKYRQNNTDYSERLSGIEIKKIATDTLGLVDIKKEIRIKEW